MATLADINTKITNLLGVDTNVYPNASRLIDINLWYQKIVSMILDSQDESDFDDQRNTDYPSYTFPLTTNRDYSVAQSYNILKIKDFSVTYDGVTYHRALPYDVSQSDLANAPASATTQNSTIDARFSKYDPRYDYKYGSIFLYPRAEAADVSAGAAGIVEFFRAPTEFTLSDLTTGTASPGIDITFHMMLAYGAAFEYAQSSQHPNVENIANELKIYEDRLRRQYSSKQLDRKYQILPDFQSYK